MRGAGAAKARLLLLQNAPLLLFLVLVAVFASLSPNFLTPTNFLNVLTQSAHIAIIAIDDQSIANIGRWPWSREVHAEMIDKLAAAGKMSWEDAHADPRRHFLRSALTGADIDLIDRSRLPLALEPGDVVIIASDGIQTLSHAEILSQVEAHATRGPDAIADALLTAVDAAGDLYQDNTTVVIVGFKGD